MDAAGIQASTAYNAALGPELAAAKQAQQRATTQMYNTCMIYNK